MSKKSLLWAVWVYECQKRFVLIPIYATATELAFDYLHRLRLLRLDSIIVDAKVVWQGKIHPAILSMCTITWRLGWISISIFQRLCSSCNVLMRIAADSVFQLPYSAPIVVSWRQFIAIEKNLWLEKKLVAVAKIAIRILSLLSYSSSSAGYLQVVGTQLYRYWIFGYNPVTNILTIVAVLDNLIKSGQSSSKYESCWASLKQMALLSQQNLYLDEKSWLWRLLMEQFCR